MIISSSLDEFNVQIFIPTYNRAIMLTRAIKSVQQQSHKNIEIIILDNASDDETQTIVNEIAESDPHLTYIRHTHNIGMMKNFNSISKLVTSPFFCVLTDDDIYEKDFLSTALHLCCLNPTSFAAILNAPTRKDGLIIGSQLSTWKEGFYPPGAALNYCINWKHPILTNCVFRKEISDIFYFEPTLGGTADVYFFVQLFCNYPTAVSKKVMGYYDIHESNVTTNNRGREALRQSIILVKMANRYLFDRGYKFEFKYPIPQWCPHWCFALYSLVYYSKSSSEMQCVIDDKEIIGHFGLVFKWVVGLLGIPIIFTLAKWVISMLKKLR